MTNRDDAPDTGAARLRRAIARARWRMAIVMRVERLAIVVVPFLGIIALFFALAWFGWFRVAPDWARIATLALLAAGLVAALWPLRKFRDIDRGGIDRRLEARNLIAHQAVTVQDDNLGNDDAFARALWTEHRRRMAHSIETLSAGVPRTDLPARDPYGLRVAVALLFVTAFAYSWSGSSGRIADAFTGHDGMALADTRVDAWITPPPYISRPPVFLTGGEVATASSAAPPAAVEAVAGSQITVRLGGPSETATVVYVDEASGVSTEIVEEAADVPADPTAPLTARVFAHKPAADGTLRVTTARGVSEWPIAITPDNPPVLAFVEEPRRAANGALELDYTVTDDFGVASAEAVIEPVDKPTAGAVTLYDDPGFRLSLPRRNAADGRALSSKDLTEHPLAGQRVTITLVGKDGAGQVGRSEPMETVLPARRFSEPLAAAIVEQRTVLARDARQVARVFELHDALTIAPDETIPNLTHYLLIQSVRGRVENARTEEDLRAAVDYMWGVALEIEDGNLSLAERKLRDAQEALQQALQDGASDEEIARLMDELRQAMQEYLRELARQAQQGQENAQNMPPDRMLRQEDLESLLDQIENLARSGARDQAQQLLSELQRMMNNLQAGRQQRPQQQGGPMRQQMDKLGELLRRQQQLMDQTFDLDRQMQERRMGEGQQDGEQDGGQDGQQQGENQQPGQQPGEGEGGKSLEEMMAELGRAQEALRRELEQLQKDLEGMGIRPGEGFGEAGEAMGDATGNLEGGDTQGAMSDQGRALQALRQGAEDMMNQMMQAMGNQQGQADGEGPDTAGRPGSASRDPLGRPRTNSEIDTQQRLLPKDLIDIQRARQILEEIRKRLGEQFSPEVEKRYLERLLDLQ